MGVYAWTDYVIYLSILAVILFLFLKLFEKMRLDKKLITAALPYMFVGTFIRLLADAEVFEWSQLWSVTPGVYVTTILLALGSIAVGFMVQRLSGISYEKTAFFLGSFLAVMLFTWLMPYITDYSVMAYTFLLAASITLAVYAASLPLKIGLFSGIGGLGILFAHMLDASSTFIAYDFHGFYEEHLLPRYIISLTGDSAFVMIPAKLILVGLVLYFLERWRKEEKDRKNTETIYLMTKLLLFIIGIGPGLRNTVLPALEL